jgi:hypothetical protein
MASAGTNDFEAAPAINAWLHARVAKPRGDPSISREQTSESSDAAAGEFRTSVVHNFKFEPALQTSPKKAAAFSAYRPSMDIKKPAAMRVSGLSWISLESNLVAGAGFEPATFGL